MTEPSKLPHHGVPEHQPTKLKRDPVDSFVTIDRFDAPSPTA
jgi:hypothetical protein